MGHPPKHVGEFQKLDGAIGLGEVIQIGRDVVKTGLQTGTRSFEKVISVGGVTVRVRAVLNYAGRLRSVYVVK